MSNTTELETTGVAEQLVAFALIDEALSTLSGRQLVSVEEVTDLLLDIRAAIDTR